MNEKKNLTIKETFALAVQNHQKNNLQVAEKLYKEILKTNPNHANTRNNLGSVLKELGESRKAISCFQKAIEIDPVNATPAYTNLGEILEELNFEADFVFKDPIFITQTVTVGKTAGHTDVSLWYVVAADSEKEIVFDTSEFNGYKWFPFQEVLETPIEKFDPHMHRFTKKLLGNLP